MTMSVRVQELSTKAIPLQRGVRQGDVISPKLFTAALEDAFKLLEWKGLGININGEYITHLRFADDIVVMAESMEDLSTMVEDLNRVSQQVGLKMNIDKTKVMSNMHVTPLPVSVGSSTLEVVDQYIYLGQLIQAGSSSFEEEVFRRIKKGLAWAWRGSLLKCTASDFYYPYNLSRTTAAESERIAAVRKSLTLDWLAVEDSRQREMVAAFEFESAPPLRMLNTDCIAYPRPSSGKIGRLMLELLKNLEGDDSVLIMEMIQTLVNAKLLVETSAMEAEPDFEALIKTPKVMMGEPHTTFPRILSMIWMMATDPPTVVKHGWCPISQVTNYVKRARPTQIAKNMRMLEPMIARARYIMEDFIQKITPINMYQKKTTRKNSKISKSTDALTVKRPFRAFDLERASLEQLIDMTTKMPSNTSSFAAEHVPNLDFSRGNAMFVTAKANTLRMCRVVIALGNMIWITMMIYDL